MYTVVFVCYYLVSSIIQYDYKKKTLLIFKLKFMLYCTWYSSKFLATNQSQLPHWEKLCILNSKTCDRTITKYWVWLMPKWLIVLWSYIGHEWLMCLPYSCELIPNQLLKPIFHINNTHHLFSNICNKTADLSQFDDVHIFFKLWHEQITINTFIDNMNILFTENVSFNCMWIMQGSHLKKS